MQPSLLTILLVVFSVYTLFNVFLFTITIVLSILLGIVFYLDYCLPSIEKDYEVFKRDGPIYFLERDHQFWDYMTKELQRSDTLVANIEFNKRFTNQSIVDDQLNEVLKLIFKDFIHPWHRDVSFSNDFPNKFYIFLNYTLSAFAQRLKGMNVYNLLNGKLLEEFIKHNRLYRLTKSRLFYKFYSNEEFISAFFSNERKMEKTFSRKKLCTDSNQLVHFLDQLCEILQYLLYPYHSFNQYTFRVFTKGIIVKNILLPLFELFSEPDFINGLFIAINRSHLPPTDIFISVLQCITDLDELRSVLEFVENEIVFVRSKDHNNDESKMKQQLGSLLYLKKIILFHINKFECNERENVDNQTSENGDSFDTKAQYTDANLAISFDTVLRHNVALSYFLEFMSKINAENYVNFYINVESFKISVEQGMFEIYLANVATDGGLTTSDEQTRQLQQLVREAALTIYETYLSPIAPSRLSLVEQNHCDKLRDLLSSADPSCWMSENLFDEIFFQVRDIILNREQFFPSFRKDKRYAKLLSESELVKDAQSSNGSLMESAHSCEELSDGANDTELVSDGKDFKHFDDMIQNEHNENLVENYLTESHSKEARTDFSTGFNVDIIETGLLNEHGKTFVAYLISVDKPNGDKWVVLRRYSEFYTFHQIMLVLCEKCHFNLKSILALPPKTVLTNRTNHTFIQYRKCMLNLYLKKLPFLYERFNFLRDDIGKFLHPGNYNRDPVRVESGNASRNGIFNPIKTIGNVMRNGSENIIDGFQKLTRTLSLQSESSRVPEKRVLQSLSLNSKLNSNNTIRSCDSSDKLSEEADTEYDSNDQLHFDKLNIVDGECNDENIPLIGLLDEIFDLKNQNFWFRRRLVELFKQIIEVTYSDMINKKISDYIDEWTSPLAVAEYINHFKNSFWPNDEFAQSTPRKTEDILRRKVAAKALLLTSLSDGGLKKVIGGETLQNGLTSLFELFQNKTLNIRLVIIMFELLLKEIFPHNYFNEIFTRLYTSFDEKSPQSSPNHESTNSDWPPHLSKLIARI